MSFFHLSWSFLDCEKFCPPTLLFPVEDGVRFCFITESALGLQLLFYAAQGRLQSPYSSSTLQTSLRSWLPLPNTISSLKLYIDKGGTSFFSFSLSVCSTSMNALGEGTTRTVDFLSSEIVSVLRLELHMSSYFKNRKPVQ